MRISGSRKPRVVTAGDPKRMPLGFMGGLVSNGIALRLAVMPAFSSAVCASLPLTPLENTSTSSRCVSVPPDTTRKPSSDRPCARVVALATTRLA